MDDYIDAQLMAATQFEFRAANNYENCEYDRASADYSKEIELNPDDGHACQSRTTVYAIKGDEPRAIADFAAVDAN
jgi:regulator of sirC expression with transglutaminase-like and TPR domain